ncbi:unnamed protein product [Danaus chrysippus]|uniref:Carboxypeptidase n=1 Tax=Danaus chrysippus TaxID=151541 RepID=A0A8J2QPJ0_9NEOP|nr:unnamed protein product [Danaus chrysippus]
MYTERILLIITLTAVADAVQIDTPLFLTAFIKENKTEEARNASLVNADEFLNITSYSGFLTVDDKYDSNLFFWYFPVANKDLKTTPWIIWLQGGPGATSLAGLFDEMGPFELDNDLNLKKRKYTWTDEFSMVYIDNPVGAGFSFTKHEEGYPNNMDMYTENLYTALNQLIVLYPELSEASLYIAGESYAGRYVPALAEKIMKEKESHINLQGIMLGNPILDRESLIDYTRAFYSWGLIDEQGALAAKPLQEQFHKEINEGNAKEAYKLRDDLLDKLQGIAEQSSLYNVITPTEGLEHFVNFITSTKIRNLIHAGNVTFDFSNHEVHTHLVADFLAPVSSKLLAVLEHYRVLIYCDELNLMFWLSKRNLFTSGQLDLTTPCVLNSEARRKRWNWSGKDEFLRSPRTPWWFNNSVAGFVKSGGRFTEVLVKGAGHLVPREKPAEAKTLISYFINGTALPKPPSYIIRPEDTPYYEEYFDLKTSKITPAMEVKSGLIASVVINVLLLAGIVFGVYKFLKWKRETDYFYSPLNDGILTMS